MRFLVWLTVTLRFAKSPRPDTVTAELDAAALPGAAEADGQTNAMPIAATPNVTASNLRCMLMAGVLADCALCTPAAVARGPGRAARRWSVSRAEFVAGCLRR